MKRSFTISNDIYFAYITSRIIISPNFVYVFIPLNTYSQIMNVIKLFEVEDPLTFKIRGSFLLTYLERFTEMLNVKATLSTLNADFVN